MTTRTERGVETPKKVSGGVEGTIRRASNGKGIQVLGALQFDALWFVTGPGFLKTGGRCYGAAARILHPSLLM